MHSPVTHAGHRVHVDAEMTVYTCSELKSRLLEQLAAHPGVTELDLSKVTELDTAGLQLLYMARRLVSEAGSELRVINPSRAVSDVLELCRLGAWLVPDAIADAE
jgi:anti-sigma B factor antagonist